MGMEGMSFVLRNYLAMLQLHLHFYHRRLENFRLLDCREHLDANRRHLQHRTAHAVAARRG